MSKPKQQISLTMWDLIEWSQELDEMVILMHDLAERFENIRLALEEEEKGDEDSRPVQEGYHCFSLRPKYWNKE